MLCVCDQAVCWQDVCGQCCACVCWHVGASGRRAEKTRTAHNDARNHLLRKNTKPDTKKKTFWDFWRLFCQFLHFFQSRLFQVLRRWFVTKRSEPALSVPRLLRFFFFLWSFGLTRCFLQGLPKKGEPWLAIPSKPSKIIIHRYCNPFHNFNCQGNQLYIYIYVCMSPTSLKHFFSLHETCARLRPTDQQLRDHIATLDIGWTRYFNSNSHGKKICWFRRWWLQCSGTYSLYSIASPKLGHTQKLNGRIWDDSRAAQYF